MPRKARIDAPGALHHVIIMGNSRDDEYIPDLLTEFYNNDDDRVLGMISWALGRISSPKAKKALDDILPQSDGTVRKEILYVLNMS